MHHHEETQHFPYSTSQLYALVADVEKYPEFLPWCRATRIIERFENAFTAEMVIAFKQLRESYVSRVNLTPPVSDNAEARIDVGLVSGPFQTLDNHWHFTPAPQGGCNVHLVLKFQFKSKLLDTIMGPLFGRAEQKMVGAFSDRAHALYR
jgi:coenzyme Q-binding protein COQ10